MQTNIIIGVLAVGGLFLLVTLFALPGTNAPDVAVTQEEGTAQETASVLPADMPTDVPMYPGAVLVRSQESEHEGVRNITLTLSTPDSVPDVNMWYRGALSENGWAVTSDKNVGGYILLKGEKENVATFTQSANGENNTVTITQRIQIK